MVKYYEVIAEVDEVTTTVYSRSFLFALPDGKEVNEGEMLEAIRNDWDGSDWESTDGDSNIDMKWSVMDAQSVAPSPEVEVDYIDDGDGEYGEAGITVEEINRMLAEAAEGGE